MNRARLGTGALLASAFAVGAAITTHTPDADKRERPFVGAGAVGQAVDGRTFDATVLSVRGAGKISDAGKPNRLRDTAGVWLVVRVRLVAHDKPTSIAHAVVRDAKGRSFLATARIAQPIVGGNAMLQPGIPVEGDVVFEVPRDAAAPGLVVRLADPRDPRLDAVVEVPLAIDSAAVDQWLADAAVAEIG